MGELVAEDVVQSYGGDTAVGPCSLQVSSGQTLVIVGPSGVGKSTLLRTLAGLQRAQSGSVTVNGTPVQSGDARVAFVFQGFALFPWRTAFRNVTFPLEVQRVGRVEQRALAMEALAQVGLADAVNKMPHHLSGGMKQRVALARALVTAPSAVLLDEPFSALDPLTRRAVRQEVAAFLHEQQCASVVVTHSLSEALVLGDHVAVLGGRPGRILGSQPVTPGAAAQDEAQLRIWLEEANASW